MNFGYKKGAKNTIIVLDIIEPLDERRDDIINPDFALFHCARAKVVKIYDMFTKEPVDSTMNLRKLHTTPTKYVVDQIVESAAAPGICYYKTETPALYYDLNPDLLAQLGLDKYRRWYKTGQLMEEWVYANGKRQTCF